MEKSKETQKMGILLSFLTRQLQNTVKHNCKVKILIYKGFRI